jgi:hypothetical protein
MKTFTHRRGKDSLRRGTMVPLVGFMLVMLFGVIAFVADLGHVIVVKSTLGAAADSAALAGAGALNQAWSLSEVRATAVEYGQANVPPHYGTVLDESAITFGDWDPDTLTFTPTGDEPNAVKVTVGRTHARDNPVSYFFARLLGQESTEVTAEAVAVGAISIYPYETEAPETVYVTSTKDLSNVVLEFADGVHQKFDGLSGYTGTFQGTGDNEGKEIVGVWIKSGCNHSGDGPGYGERVTNPSDGSTIHGANKAKGCTPHVTATFQATGVEFTESGAPSPIRLVQ